MIAGKQDGTDPIIYGPPRIPPPPPNSQKCTFLYILAHIRKTGSYFYLPRRRRPGTGDITTPPSVCPSVRPSRLVCWNYCKVPLHLQLLVKWEVVSPNCRYREFYHKIGNIEKCPFTYWLNGAGGFSKS